jgi:DNA polymerase-4
LKACPDAAVVKPDMAKYAAAGRQVRAILQDLTPTVEPVSIDEAYLDLRGCEAVNGGPAAMALMRAQARIEREVGVTVSVGLSCNKLLAKIASDLDKPRGFAVIGAAEAPTLLAAKPLSILPGVGPAGAKALAALKLRTIGDLQRADIRTLAGRLGPWGATLHAFAHGRDARPVDPEGERKTLSAETTFHEDLKSLAALEDRLWLLAERVATRARAAEIAGRTVTIKLKSTDFHATTRRRTLPEPTLLAARIFTAAQPLLAAEIDGRRAYRLIGVGLSDLSPAADADRGDLLDADTPRRAAAEAAAAHARERFGALAVETGRSLRIRRQRSEP